MPAWLCSCAVRAWAVWGGATGHWAGNTQNGFKTSLPLPQAVGGMSEAHPVCHPALSARLCCPWLGAGLGFPPGLGPPAGLWCFPRYLSGPAVWEQNPVHTRPGQRRGTLQEAAEARATGATCTAVVHLTLQVSAFPLHFPATPAGAAARPWVCLGWSGADLAVWSDLSPEREAPSPSPAL